ncbi:SGNH/GDSL hydrolase family protein [Streptomyces sp. J2-1]|nr:SGNH/GDSL hydrolase family protein [Streptomyces corallincola]
MCAASAALLLGLAWQQTPARAAGPPAASTGSGVVTWAASADRLGEGVPGRAYRLVVRTSVGGDRVRLRISNAFGDRPLTLDAVRAGLQSEGAALRPGSNRRVTFDGAAAVTVPAGATAWSDPVPLRLPARASLAVSLHSPDAAGPATGHGLALQTSYTAEQDRTADESGAGWTGVTEAWWYLDAVSVRPAGRAAGAVVALGDSITDGWQSPTDGDQRWPDHLADRLHRADGTVQGVANAGISGNRVLSDSGGVSALARLDRDVLSQPGLRTVFLFEGVNDIKAHTGVTAPQMIDGYREIVRRAHAAGVCVVGATVGPFKGWSEWDPQAEEVRQEINQYVREGGGFDAVADFDRTLRSPYDPERMNPLFDNGDHLHPNAKGMRSLAGTVDLGSLECHR